MQGVGLFEDHSSLIEDPSSSPGVDGRGREQPQVYVPVVVVVPIDEPAAAVEGVVEAFEAIWEVGMVLERLELALGVGVVVAGMWPAVGPGDPEGCHELADSAARHRRTAVGMDRELVGANLLLDRGLAKEPLGKVLAFTMGEHPADDISAVDVDDDVEVEIGPFLGPEELRDVPRPDLIRGRGLELRLGVCRMSELVATLPHLLVGVEDPVHRAGRAVVFPLVQKRGVGLRRGFIRKWRAVQRIKDRLPLLGIEGPRAGGTRLGFRLHRRALSVDRRPRHSEGGTSCHGADGVGQVRDRGHGSLS